MQFERSEPATRLRRFLSVVLASTLLAAAPISVAQNRLAEDFEDLSDTPSGSHGPPELIARGWSFRNQSDPQSYGNWHRSAWSYEGRWSLYVDWSVSRWNDNNSEASSWAVLPAIPGQVAGDELSFFFSCTPFPDFDPTAHLEIRYSPSGGTNTGSSAQDVGDFTELLSDIPDSEDVSWPQHRVTLPGSGRIAFRFHIVPVIRQLDYSGDFSIDTLRVTGNDLPCNLPPIPAPGEHVTWLASDSPYEICETLTIPAGGSVTVEPGVTVLFDPDRQLRLLGSLDVQGSADAHVVFTAPAVYPPMVVANQATLTATYLDVRGQLRVESGATVELADSSFAANGLLWVQEIQAVTPFVQLQRCTFTNSQMSMSDAFSILEDNTFDNSYASILRGYSDLRGTNTFNGRPLQFIREERTQDYYLDGVHASGVSSGAGLEIQGGNFVLGPNTVLQGNLYPLFLGGGLYPDSTLPLTGNTINAIDVGSGAAFGWARWPDMGIPYRLTAEFGVGGFLTIDPGVTIEAADPNARMAYGNGPRLVAEGLPDAPITFQGVGGASWLGLLFQVNSSAGPHLEYVHMKDARFGVISSDNTMYVSNCVFENNQVGANCNTYGSTFFDKTRFIANDVGVSMTDIGHPELYNPSNPNSFEGNGAAIDAFESGSSGDAGECWWNDPTGPQHPLNPDGQGDPVIGPGASAVNVFPFLTEPPNFDNTPPVVRLVEPGVRWSTSPDFFLDPGTKLIIRWDVQDDDGVVSQRIAFSRDGHYRTNFHVVVDNLPPTQRSYEWTVPDPGFAYTNQPQFLRVIATDVAGQEGWDQTPIVVSSGRIEGELIITTDLTGQVFYAGEDIPSIQWTGSLSGFPTVTPYVLLEGDGSGVSGLNVGGEGVFFKPFPNVTTDAARLALRASNNSNDIAWFFAPGYFSIRHDPRFGFVPPNVQLATPAQGASFSGGTVVPVSWTADAAQGLRSFDIYASYDGGRTWHVVVHELPADARSFDWLLPASDLGIADVRVRVVAYDARFQNATTDPQRSFTILPGSGGVPGDLNGDGCVDQADLGILLAAFGVNDGGDLDGDGDTDQSDLGVLLANWGAGCG